jgi:hypothetical protein
VHQRVEGTALAHGAFEGFFDGRRVVEEIDAECRCASACGFDRRNRCVGRRIAVGEDDASELLARERGSDAGRQPGSRSRYERTPIQRAARSAILVRSPTKDRTERRRRSCP